MLRIDQYAVLPVQVSHSVPAVGYQVTRGGRSFFYTGDSGPGLAECWQHISPDLLVIEVTTSNRWSDFGRESRHLTPDLLKEELVDFQKLKGYIPKVVTVHMNPPLESEIKAELAEAASELGCDISLAHEGLELTL